MSFKSFAVADLAQPKVHDLLLSAIAPRPIAFVSTIDENGVYNLAPFSFFNVFSSNPPIAIFSPARSGRTGEPKHTHTNVLKNAACVINIANQNIIHQLNLAAGMYPSGVDEFKKSGLTPIPSVKINVPRVAECFVQYECIVKEVIETGTGGGAGNLIICEVVMIHVNEAVIDAENNIDPLKMKYIARLGKQYWCNVNEENIFTLPSFKMANELGIGYDALPDFIKKSELLSANEIAQLATVTTLPEKDATFNAGTSDYYTAAKAAIAAGDLATAWQYLWLAE
jgi:flavin reductase (DIM6/NTAB) family NADH-FMN oxidoreductase RutF